MHSYAAYSEMRAHYFGAEIRSTSSNTDGRSWQRGGVLRAGHPLEAFRNSALSEQCSFDFDCIQH